MLLCRTFGACFINKSIPGLTAGPIDCQPFGPPGACHNNMRDSIITLAVNHAARYYPFVIQTFKCADTEALSKGERVRRFGGIAAIARRELRQLEIAARLDDLRVPPGNRLQALKGDRSGPFSIRINDQFRVCFRWTNKGAEDVAIVDYY
jgi:proteic killer suppression protein